MGVPCRGGFREDLLSVAVESRNVLSLDKKDDTINYINIYKIFKLMI